MSDVSEQFSRTLIERARVRRRPLPIAPPAAEPDAPEALIDLGSGPRPGPPTPRDPNQAMNAWLRASRRAMTTSRALVVPGSGQRPYTVTEAAERRVTIPGRSP